MSMFYKKHDLLCSCVDVNGSDVHLVCAHGGRHNIFKGTVKGTLPHVIAEIWTPYVFTQENPFYVVIDVNKSL